MSKNKIIIIIVLVVIIIAVILGVIYQFVLKDKTKIIHFEDIFDGEATTEILEKELDIKLGLFAIIFNLRHGKDEPKQKVTLTNKLTEAKSFTIEIAAINKETEEVIKTDILEVEALEPGKEEVFYMFTDIEEERHKEFLNAEYKIVKVTSE